MPGKESGPSKGSESTADPIPLGIVVARANSQRLPRKNLLKFQGVPLFIWAARAMVASRACTKVLVSTDDESVVRLATEYGISAQKRVAACSYESTVADVCIEALEQSSLGYPESIACVYGTAFRLSPSTIRAACQLFRQTGAASLMGVSAPRLNPYQALRVSADGKAQSLFPQHVGRPPEPAEQLRISNGTIYISTSESLTRQRSFYGPGLFTVDVPEREVTDINTAADARRLGLSTD